MEFEDLFFKNSLLKLYILDLILTKKLKEKVIPDILADDFNINLNTVKKVIRDLTEEGYFVTKKKSGTNLNYFPNDDKVKNYFNIKNKFFNLIESARNFGFSENEIVAGFVSALKDYNSKKNTEKKIIFVEKDFSNLWIGKNELEEILGVDVVPMLLDDALKYLKRTKNNNEIVITTYYCQQVFEAEKIKVFPLKITPPIEQLININFIPEDENIVILTISEELKERLKKTYKFLQKKFKNLKFLTIREIVENPDILKDIKILLTLKTIYNDNKELFKNVKKVVVYSRFHDDEGLQLLRKIIEESDE